MSNADIPVVILCGRMGTRLREAGEKLPKPPGDIGGKPILLKYLSDAQTFALTDGDGIGDVDLRCLVTARRAGRMGMVTAVHPASDYGEMKVAFGSDVVGEFNENPTLADEWVSGRFLSFWTVS